MATNTEEVFPEADVAATAGGEELIPGQQNTNLQVEHVSPNLAAEQDLSAQIENKNKEQEQEQEKEQEKEKEETKNGKKEKDDEKKEGIEALKTTIIVSGIIVAVVGAIYAITKKLREK